MVTQGGVVARHLLVEAQKRGGSDQWREREVTMIGGL
jgi:hypothetical protein